MAAAHLTLNFPPFIRLANHNHEIADGLGLKANCRWVYPRSIDRAVRGVLLLVAWKILDLWREYLVDTATSLILHEVAKLFSVMSWAKEEWKQGLTANVMKNVFDLEQRCETLQKESKQRQFQMESLQAALAKQKKVTEDEKANALSLKKENHSLSESIQELERSREKNLHDLNAKEGQIRCLDGKLSRSQQMLEAETASNLQLKNDLDHLQHDQNQLASKFEKQAADFSKLKEANIFLKRQLAGKLSFGRAFVLKFSL